MIKLQHDVEIDVEWENFLSLVIKENESLTVACPQGVLGNQGIFNIQLFTFSYIVF